VLPWEQIKGSVIFLRCSLPDSAELWLGSDHEHHDNNNCYPRTAPALWRRLRLLPPWAIGATGGIKLQVVLQLPDMILRIPLQSLA
jgi:hypothetical protein